MARITSFRVGSVKGYLRNRIWYLCYHEHGQRRRPRVGPDLKTARQLAAEINGQLAAGAPAALSFEPVTVPELRRRWLEHHEQVLRSSVQTINRYRTATEHLVSFLTQRPVRHAAHFTTAIAEEFVRHLRTMRVSPNGHANTVKRPLLDKGLRFILECCRAMFNYAAKRRHMSPYSENPFASLEIDRIPIEEARPIVLLTPDEEVTFLQACDGWQFPLFATLLFTGLRSGELCHLLLPEDLDLEARVIRVRNKPALGWQVKTRNQRDVPLVPELVEVLRKHLRGRTTGPVFLKRGCLDSPRSPVALEREPIQNPKEFAATPSESTRATRLRQARLAWRLMGAVEEDRVRTEFIRVAKRAGLVGQSAPKIIRHQFATALQEGRVDPLIRNILMGHASSENRAAGHGLGMTAVYTHSRPEVIRKQLESAFVARSSYLLLDQWVQQLEPSNGCTPSNGITG